MKRVYWAGILAFVAVFAVVWLLPARAWAEDMMGRQLDMLDFETVQKAVSQSDNPQAMTFRELTEQAMTGQLDISPRALTERLLDAGFAELRTNGALLRNLLIICVLSALLKNLTESFKNKSAGELGFYVCYIVLVVLLFTSFQTAVALTRDTAAVLTGIMQAGIPLIISLLVMSGSVGAAYLFSPVLIFAVNVTAVFVSGFVAPLAVLGASVEIVNYITEKAVLENLAALIKGVCGWSMRVVAMGFAGIIAMQKLSAPILNTAASKTAKAAAGAVPVVGDMLGGAWDMAAVWANAARSGVLAAFIITLAAACFFPALKLLALVIILKVTSALIQPVCDERVTRCVESVGGYSVTLLGCLATVVIMFVMFAVILLSF